MFDFVHSNKKTIQIIMALVVLPFAFWGIGSYTRSGNSAEAVAKVNGVPVTQQELGNALQRHLDRLHQQLGAKFKAEVFDTPEMKRTVLDDLIARQLLIDRARADGLATTDEQVAQLIRGIESFQNQGKFDKDLYESILKNQGMTPLIFETKVREELLGQQLQDAYAMNGFASQSIAAKVRRLYEQERIVQTASISTPSFMKQIAVKEGEIKQYYDNNQAEFKQEERARVDYVELSEADLLEKVKVRPEAVKEYYDTHQSEFGTQEERRAAHILVSASVTSSPSERKAAKEKAEQILQEVKKAPGNFAELAKKYSQDPGSATDGGDLGFFGRGMMVKPFEDAAFAMKKGEISGIVPSDFGYHIIKLLDINPSRALPFDEVRESIANKLRQQQAADRFAELADKFSNTVYEQSDTLQSAADLAGLKVQRSDWLEKGKSSGVPWTDEMLTAIFNDETVKNKRNTAAIEVQPNTLVSARILEYKPASVRALGEVHGEIRLKLMRQQAQRMAVDQGERLLKELREGKNPKVSWDKSQNISRMQHGTLNTGLVRQIFQADSTKLPQYTGMQDVREGYVLVKINSVNEKNDSNGPENERYASQLKQLTGEELSRAYMDNAKRLASIEINLPQVNENSQP